jgi:hypothetical protein
VAQQQILYDNGPVNGQTNALLINLGAAVSNSFEGNGLLDFSGFTFWVWLLPGDSLESIDVAIGSTPFGTDQYHNTFQGVEAGNCFINHFGYNVCQVSIEFFGYFPENNLWLTLQNAEVSNGDPAYWDQNFGAGCHSQGCPSRALQKSSLTPPASAIVPSEAFTIYGVMINEGTSTCNATHSL